MRTVFTLGDGYVSLHPIWPDALQKELRYWQRISVVEGYQRVMSGKFRECYEITHDFDEAGAPMSKLVTMPGFAGRIKTCLSDLGWEIEYRDVRTPFPQPDIHAAVAGLRDYQLECCYVSLTSGGGIFCCPTGWGKTRLIAAHCRAFSHAELCARNTPTIVVAAKDQEICRQNAEAIAKVLPERDVGLVMSGVRRFSDDIQVITLDSLKHVDPASVGIVIVDEAHELATETRSESITLMGAARRWGASATPTGRFDGSDRLTEGLLGPVIYRRTYQEAVTDGAVIPIHAVWMNVPEPSCGLKQYLGMKMRKAKYDRAVVYNDAQNDIIVSLFGRIPASMQTLAIMSRTDQMNELVPRLPGVEYVHAKTDPKMLQKSRQFDLSAIKTARRAEIYADIRSGNTRQAMATHVYKQGVDFPLLEVLIQAGGGGSEIAGTQIPGRASRPMDAIGKDCAWLIDFWHPWDTIDKDGKPVPGPVLKDDRSRSSLYKKLGFSQVWINSVDELPFLGTDGNKLSNSQSGQLSLL